jgi:hypothetical protein
MFYTSFAAIALGGHFLLPEVAHLTEMGRQVDVMNTMTSSYTTSEHLAVAHLVAYMMYSLPMLPGNKGKSSFMLQASCLIAINRAPRVCCKSSM